jgi:hypothetical protein
MHLENMEHKGEFSGGLEPVLINSWEAVGRVKDFKDIQILIPGTYKYTALHGKRAIADVVKAKALGLAQEMSGSHLITWLLKAESFFCWVWEDVIMKQIQKDAMWKRGLGLPLLAKSVK